ncbi:MAG: hypothetical protein COA50_01165 [Flavobacteriaceae bacterium]|nr:MAG: hypothetical protein COA50_01165 [Flavobacteriaceae bacterium]
MYLGLVQVCRNRINSENYMNLEVFSEIPDLVFSLLIAIIVLIIPFVITKGILSNLTFTSKWWKVITPRGRNLIVLNLIIFSLMTAQYCYKKQRLITIDNLLKAERIQRDSLIRQGVKEESDILYNRIAIIFANQGIKIESLLSEVEGTSTTNNSFMPPNDPFFHPDNDPFKFTSENDTLKFFLNMVSLDAGSTNFNIKAQILTQWSDNVEMSLSKTIILSKNRRLKKGQLVPVNLMGYVVDITMIEYIHVHLKGTYTDLHNSKTYFIDEVLKKKVNDKNGVTYFVGNHAKDSIINIMENLSKSLNK